VSTQHRNPVCARSSSSGPRATAGLMGCAVFFLRHVCTVVRAWHALLHRAALCCRAVARQEAAYGLLFSFALYTVQSTTRTACVSVTARRTGESGRWATHCNVHKCRRRPLLCKPTGVQVRIVLLRPAAGQAWPGPNSLYRLKLAEACRLGFFGSNIPDDGSQQESVQSVLPGLTSPVRMIH
jgi:hypothetical protein